MQLEFKPIKQVKEEKPKSSKYTLTINFDNSRISVSPELSNLLNLSSQKLIIGLDDAGQVILANHNQGWEINADKGFFHSNTFTNQAAKVTTNQHGTIRYTINETPIFNETENLTYYVVTDSKEITREVKNLTETLSNQA